MTSESESQNPQIAATQTSGKVVIITKKKEEAQQMNVPSYKIYDDEESRT